MTIRAAIDTGSNSIKLLVLEIQDNGVYRILWNESRVTRLGKGISRGGFLDVQSKADSLDCLADYVERCRKLEAASIRAAGTSALREAEDAAEFIADVRAQLGLGIEVISGSEEARLSRTVALNELHSTVPDVVFFDVGGNSTEVTWCRNGEVHGEASLELGARRCTAAAEVVHPVSASARERLQAMIETHLRDAPVPPRGDGGTGNGVLLAGLGGTATSLAWMLQGLRGEGISDPHLAVVSLADTGTLLSVIRPRPAAEVRAMANLDPKRADVVYAGITVIAGILRHYDCTEFVLVDRGLRFGLLLA